MAGAPLPFDIEKTLPMYYSSISNINMNNNIDMDIFDIEDDILDNNLKLDMEKYSRLEKKVSFLNGSDELITILDLYGCNIPLELNRLGKDKNSEDIYI